mgnify:CR=1 FL=1
MNFKFIKNMHIKSRMLGNCVNGGLTMLFSKLTKSGNCISAGYFVYISYGPSWAKGF